MSLWRSGKNLGGERGGGAAGDNFREPALEPRVRFPAQKLRTRTSGRLFPIPPTHCVSANYWEITFLEILTIRSQMKEYSPACAGLIVEALQNGGGGILFLFPKSKIPFSFNSLSGSKMVWLKHNGSNLRIFTQL